MRLTASTPYSTAELRRTSTAGCAGADPEKDPGQGTHDASNPPLERRPRRFRFEPDPRAGSVGMRLHADLWRWLHQQFQHRVGLVHRDPAVPGRHGRLEHVLPDGRNRFLLVHTHRGVHAHLRWVGRTTDDVLAHAEQQRLLLPESFGALHRYAAWRVHLHQRLPRWQPDRDPSHLLLLVQSNLVGRPSASPSQPAHARVDSSASWLGQWSRPHTCPGGKTEFLARARSQSQSPSTPRT